MRKKNYYKVLGAEVDEPIEKIHWRYRNLVKKVHPDVSDKADITKFAEYTEAHKILSTEREKYNVELGIFKKPRALLPGHHLYQRLTLTHEQALEGGIFPLSFLRYEPCPSCWREGCSKCRDGVLPIQVTVSVSVPPKVITGTQLLIEKQGGCAEPGGSRGSLIVHIFIKANK